MTHKTWLLQRAMLALLLMVSFYVLALGVAAVLVSIPYEAYVNDVRLPAKLALVCLGLAGTIVWSILPRFDRFVPPGPAVTAAEAPQLFAVLTEVAAETQQHMPADVYLVNQVNAFVTERGGIMGLGSRRVMGIGVPLMQTVTVQELKAILAHEFGHYHAGDVKVGPWIYKTRAAIGRTIQHLSSSMLQKLFVWYGNLFLRITHAVSRRQEFIADEVAARVAGATAMMSALRKVHGAAGAFDGYWNSEVGPVLSSGHLPPITAGFATFVATGAVSARIAEAVRKEEAEGESDPFDTHPPLRERIDALRAASAGSAGDTRPALSLLGDAERWERRLLAVAVNGDWAQSLTPVPWDQVIDTVYVPLWRTVVRERAALLSGITPSSLPFAGRLAGPPLDDEAQRVFLQTQTVGIALCLALLAAGWTASNTLGEGIVFRRDGHELRPFVHILSVATGTLAPTDWSERCARAGIDRLNLAATS